MIKKSIARVFKIVFMATMLIAVTACDNPNSPANPEVPGATDNPDTPNNPENPGTNDDSEKSYPENITDDDKTSINDALIDSDTADFDSLKFMLSEISSFLDKYNSENKAVEYKSTVDSIISEIDNANITALDALLAKNAYVTPAEYTKIENNNYTNYSDYEEAIFVYNYLCDSYKSYYDYEYSEIYDAYKEKFDELSANPINFTELTDFLRKLVKDFKDNFLLDNTYTTTQVQTLIQNVENEQEEMAYSIEELAQANKILNNSEISISRAYSELINFEFVTLETKTVYSGTTGFSEADFLGFDIIYIALPDDATEVDVVDFYNTKLAVGKIRAKMNEWFEIEFAPYPETATKYKFELPEGTDNNEFMKQINNPRMNKFQNVGDFVSVEMVPGVEIVATMLEDENLYRNIKFKKQNNITSVDIDLSKNEFDLTEMKDVGIEVDLNLQYNLKNLGNTNFKGYIKNNKMVKFNEFYLNNLSNSIDNSNLPSINNIRFIESNLFGSGLDKVISYYYRKNAETKLPINFGNSFNGIVALDNEYMYNDKNEYNNNAYEMDINAFMYMNTNDTIIKNVKVTGDNITNINKLKVSAANIRFETDVSDVDFTNMSKYGILDFASKAPSKFGYSSGRIILRSGSVEKGFNFGDLIDLDVKELDSKDFSKLHGNYATVGQVNYSSMDAANTTIPGAVIDNKIVNDTLISGDYGKVLSNQEIEEFGRDGRVVDFDDE